MEKEIINIFAIRNLCFTYPEADEPALRDISFEVPRGGFLLLGGDSGSGKTTLLRHLKPDLSPHGQRTGEIYFMGCHLDMLTPRESAAKIAFVGQSAENQLITDKVWHELAFSLESLGLPNQEIRRRVAETASFFGIEHWFEHDTNSLSGGEKQLLNIAAAVVTEPEVLVLDEPTAQLDPINAASLLANLVKVNEELGITIILSEQRLGEIMPLTRQAAIMQQGQIIACCAPRDLLNELSDKNMLLDLPVPMRVQNAVRPEEKPVFLSAREGREWLARFAETNSLKDIPSPPHHANKETAVELRNIWFRYEKNSPDVLKGLSLNIAAGEIFALCGGNGTGKSTLLSLAAGIIKPQRGEIRKTGRPALLPQNPQTLFSRQTVEDELRERFGNNSQSAELITQAVAEWRLGELLRKHPHDISGGEMQRLAMAKILAHSPDIILLDEPTKGLDPVSKKELGEKLRRLRDNGAAVLIASHDIEFCAVYADRCGLCFNGEIMSMGQTADFFSGGSFYTTAANRMARERLPQAITATDIINACQNTESPAGSHGNSEADCPDSSAYSRNNNAAVKITNGEIAHRQSADSRKVRTDSVEQDDCPNDGNSNFTIEIAGEKISPSQNTSASIPSDSTVSGTVEDINNSANSQYELAQTDTHKPHHFPKNRWKNDNVKHEATAGTQTANKRASKIFLMKATVIAGTITLIALTVWLGARCFGERRYFIMSMLVALECLLPFLILFERRRPQAREIVLLAALCTIAVAGRAIFAPLPQFKPVIALIIISGCSLGAGRGFIIGMLTAFISNMFFGQGAWTLWQMLSLGIIGALSGVLFAKNRLSHSKTALSIFGVAAAILIFGGINNPSYLLMVQSDITASMLVAVYAAGLPFDIVQAVATVTFLCLLSQPMITRLKRIRIKYGLS